jgi:hypothetical protein
MTALAGSVGYWGPMLLDRLPHSYEDAASGMGKAVWTNKRVLIVLALLILAIRSESLKYRLWAIPLCALLSTAVLQHKLNYESSEALTETFE